MIFLFTRLEEKIERLTRIFRIVAQRFCCVFLQRINLQLQTNEKHRRYNGRIFK